MATTLTWTIDCKISGVADCLNYKIQKIQVVLNSCQHGSSVGFNFDGEQS